MPALFLRYFLIVCLLISGTPPLSAQPAGPLPELPPGPLILTSVVPEQLNPEYWIARHPYPDRVLKTPEQIREMNKEIHAMISQRVDIFRMETRRSGAGIRKQMELEFNALRGRTLYFTDNSRVPKSHFDVKIKPIMQTGKVPERITMQWGIAARSTSVRALPYDTVLMEKLNDPEFDMQQFSKIKPWTPVGIFHTSSDGQWVYLQAPYIRGWVKKKDIVFFDRETIRQKLSASFLVVTGESIPLFKDAGLSQFDQQASMGTILPLAGSTENSHTIWMPRRGADGKGFFARGFVSRKSDVSKGFLSFTPRNVIRQAFKLLGARYGWGGTYEGRDCSGFIQDVFLPFGIAMPRGSKEQAFVGTQISHFEPHQDPGGKAAAIRAGIPGVTLMRMPSHQMIFLGELNNKFYAIHCTWAERISMTSDERNRINQVVVSDLSLNGNSYLGSLFDRIISVSEVN